MATNTENREGELNVTTGATETLNETKDSQASRIARGTRKVRTNAIGNSETQRFFLAKSSNGGGAPELGKEFTGEPEVMAESFKTGLNYFVVSEWRGVADFSGRKPQLGREAARSAPKAG
jgi:hypothetical protein